MKHHLFTVASIPFFVSSLAFAQTPAPAAATPAPVAAAAPAPTPSEDPPTNENKKEDDEPHRVSITFSPLHLIFPEFKAMVELRATRKMGVALLGGIGSVKVDDALGQSNRFTVWELGGQFKYYLIGSFQHGMEIGGQAEYAGVSGKNDTGTVFGTAGGFAVGPFIGYKLATKIGFTIDLQAGAQYAAIGASAVGSDGTSASAHEARLLPLVNLHLGWSF